MHYEDYIPDALEMVLAWNLDEEDLADAVNDPLIHSDEDLLDTMSSVFDAAADR